METTSIIALTWGVFCLGFSLGVTTCHKYRKRMEYYRKHETFTKGAKDKAIEKECGLLNNSLLWKAKK